MYHLGNQKHVLDIYYMDIYYVQSCHFFPNLGDSFAELVQAEKNWQPISPWDGASNWVDYFTVFLQYSKQVLCLPWDMCKARYQWPLTNFGFPHEPRMYYYSSSVHWTYSYHIYIETSQWHTTLYKGLHTSNNTSHPPTDCHTTTTLRLCNSLANLATATYRLVHPG